MGQASINRGKKWSEVLEKAKFDKREMDVAWLNKQKDILNDIKNYEESINPKKKVK